MSPAWLTLSAVAAVVVVFLGNLTHFTWWVVLQFVLLTGLIGVGVGERFVITFVVQSLLTIFGVLSMSIMNCTLLNDAATEWGAAYVPLNFLVHYVPVLVVFAAPPREPPTNVLRQVLHGVGIFTAYVVNRSALDTYGCDMPIWPVLAAALAAILLVTTPEAESFLCKCFCHTDSAQYKMHRQGNVTHRQTSRRQPIQQYKAKKTQTTTPPTTAAITRFI